MPQHDLSALLNSNRYPGRGLIVGASSDKRSALTAYFIMGRSENSRNRVFERLPDRLRTRAFDESKVDDPSLILYSPYRALENVDILTNGDQTDTICDTILAGGEDAFKRALMTRTYEPDAPHYTPRIAAAVTYDFPGHTASCEMALLKRDGGTGNCLRAFFRYSFEAGIGHLLHTYRCDGDPLPSFEGEPKEVALPDSAEALAALLWTHLDTDNKISLFVRQVPLDGGRPEEIILNKNGGSQ